MSADDQRAALRRLAEQNASERHADTVLSMFVDLDRLRAELAETRAAAAVTTSLCEEYGVERSELAERVNSDRLMAMAFDQLVDERERDLRAAGDALAAAVAPIERMGRGAPGSRLEVLITRADEWRSVRGDAPTAGGLLPDKRIRINLTPPSRAIPAAERRNLAAELRSRFVDGPVDEWSAGWLSAAGYIGSDSPIGVDPGTDLTASTVEPAEPSAVGLPVTLSSPDDVGTVCAHLGMSQVRERTWYCNPQVTVWAAGTCDEGTGGVEIDSVPLHLDVQFPAATSLVVAAIEAARGGSR